MTLPRRWVCLVTAVFFPAGLSVAIPKMRPLSSPSPHELQLRTLSMVAPPKSFSNRPVNEEGFANDVRRRERAPVTRVEAVHGVVAHDHQVSLRDYHSIRFAF